MLQWMHFSLTNCEVLRPAAPFFTVFVDWHLNVKMSLDFRGFTIFKFEKKIR